MASDEGGVSHTKRMEAKDKSFVNWWRRAESLIGHLEKSGVVTRPH